MITQDWKVEFNAETEKYYIAVPEPCDCGCSKCKGVNYRPHTSGVEFDESEDALEWIESVQEAYDDSQERYYEENSYAIRQSELYDMWRNEY